MQTIRNAKDIYDLVKTPLLGEEQENLLVVTLNNVNRVTGIHTLCVGSDTSVTISSKLVARTAVINNACGVILVHNHPSGVPEPSKADISATQKVKDALDLLDISLLDHVIVGDGCFFSFSDEKTQKA